jgi:hypothetical protein
MRQENKIVDIKTLTEGISADDWAQLAKFAKTSPEDLKRRYEARLAEHPQNLQKIEIKLGDPVRSGDCLTQPFNIGLFNIIGLSGSVQFCENGGNDWSATGHVSLDVAGSSVWSTDYTLSPNNTSVCYHPSFFAVKADLCFGIMGDKHCFTVSGDACYWAGTWNCGNFDKTVYCFG